MNAKMNEWLTKELEKARTSRKSIKDAGLAVEGSPAWDHYVSIGGKITVYNAAIEWIKAHPEKSGCCCKKREDNDMPICSCR